MFGLSLDYVTPAVLGAMTAEEFDSFWASLGTAHYIAAHVKHRRLKEAADKHADAPGASPDSPASDPPSPRA